MKAVTIRALLALLSLSQAASFAPSPMLLTSPARLNSLRCPPRALPLRSQGRPSALSLSLETVDNKKVFSRREQLAFSLAFVGADWIGSGRAVHAADEDVVVRALTKEDAKELEVRGAPHSLSGVAGECEGAIHFA